VVQHIHDIILAGSRRCRHTTTSLEILLSIAKHHASLPLTPLPITTPPLTNPPLIDAAWIYQLLKDAAEKDVADGEFILFLRLSARRKEEDSTVAAETPPDQEGAHTPDLKTDQMSLGRPVTTETPTLNDTLFNKIMKSIQTCVTGEDGWDDEAIYGGLIVIKDIRRMGPSLLDDGVLQTLYDAMDNRRPFRVRKAACDVMLVTGDQWLKSAGLRQKLKELNFLRQLHGVVVDIASSGYQRQFLMMMEVLSEDEYWQPYLRNAMNIWLPFRHEGHAHALRILTNVGGLWLPRRDGSDPPSPSDKSLEKWVEEEWAAVPTRHVSDLAFERLKSLVEVTEQFIELSFNKNDRKDVLAMVERVIPSLKKRCEEGYEGPGEEVCGIVNDLVNNLRSPPSPATRRQSTYHW
jgi:hypothetical protein